MIRRLESGSIGFGTLPTIEVGVIPAMTQSPLHCELNGIRTHDLRDTGEILYQPSYEATDSRGSQWLELSLNWAHGWFTPASSSPWRVSQEFCSVSKTKHLCNKETCMIVLETETKRCEWEDKQIKIKLNDVKRTHLMTWSLHPC